MFQFSITYLNITRMHAYCTRANPNMVVLDLTFDQYRIKKKHLKFCVKVEDRSGYIVNPFQRSKTKGI